MPEDDELDAAFSELERRVGVYARTWWTRPGPHRDFLEAHPEVGPSLSMRLLNNYPTETWHLYTAPEGAEWSTDRVPEQLRILDLLDATDPVGNDADIAEPAGNIYFVLGLPGSGKSKVLRRIAAAHAARTALPVSDADDVRTEFPEYGNGHGSGVVQVETALVTYGEKHLDGGGRQNRVLGKDGYAIVDVIGDQRYLPGTIEILARSGRKCYVLLADCPVEECKRRAKQRALETGRVVPMAFI